MLLSVCVCVSMCAPLVQIQELHETMADMSKEMQKVQWKKCTRTQRGWGQESAIVAHVYALLCVVLCRLG